MRVQTYRRLHICRRTAGFVHEVLGVFSCLDQYGLLYGLIDDELIADQVIVDLYMLAYDFKTVNA